MRFPFPKRDADTPAAGGDAENCLAITACGDDKTGLVGQLSGKIADSGCNIEESRMAVLGGKFALVMLVSGPWHAMSRLESQLPALGEQLGLVIVQERTGKRERTQQAIPYNVELVTMDRPGIVHSLSSFFARNSINIEDLQTSTYFAAQTGTPMLSLVMTIGIPSNVHIATLRGDFLDYCDDLNLDATFEPVRG
jgi:glycine cleavage system transcriptional repressor